MTFNLGGSLLWFGWFGFNGAGGLKSNSVAALAAGTTQLSCAFAFTVFIVLDWIFKGKPTVVCSYIRVQEERKTFSILYIHY